MIVRCGACRNQFDVPGPGRYACPVCGSVNVVRAGAPGPGGGQPSPPPGGSPGFPGAGAAAPPPPPPDRPSPRVSCPRCDFRFIVGEIALATCPNCGAEVPTGIEVPESQET